ncbi:pilus assembly protein [Paenibacillus cremeus]|uniref:pilus assembly protein n=1 Tax=Paenibacillus cremeus TaxID=2163881 RepID=UPI0021BD1FEC|nr:pilus assembly protein [Paenibacillus cremeus]
MARADMALQSAVSESAKVAAANMYPVEQVYRKGQAKWANSRASGWLNNVVSQAESAREKVIDAETFSEEYERWIPDALLQLVRIEQERREQLEAWGQSTTEEAKNQLNQKLAEAATPVVASLTGVQGLDRKRLKVTSIGFPDLDDKTNSYITIEAQYEYHFAVPFYHKTVLLKKKAVERAWVGGAG